MHAAQRASVYAERVIYLTEMIDEIMLTEFIFAKRASEEAAIIAFFFEVNEVRACERSWREDHEKKSKQDDLD